MKPWKTCGSLFAIWLTTQSLIDNHSCLVLAQESELEPDQHLRALQKGNPIEQDQQPEKGTAPYRGIISGERADCGDYQWHAVFEGRILCGGTIVGDGNFVLTAAHCVDDYTPPSVRVGSFSRTTGGTVYSVTNKWIHPEYSAPRLLNDIALLKIATNCVCKPPSVILNCDQAFPSTTGQSLSVIGFGRTTGGGSPAGTLQKLGVDFVNNADCSNRYGNFEEEMKICADKDGAGTCQGDSGSPLLHVDSQGQKTQVGIVSYGINSCASSYPDYYARVSNYGDWIGSTIKEELAINGPDRESIMMFLRRNGLQGMQRLFFGPWNKASQSWKSADHCLNPL